MSDELFTVFLTAVVGKAVEWAAGELLGVRTICCRCGNEQDDARLKNRAANNLVCVRCRTEVTQYTNACQTTVDPRTGRIGHVAVTPANAKRFTWEEARGWGNHGIAVPLRLRAEGLSGRSLIVQSELRQYNDDAVIVQPHLLVRFGRLFGYSMIQRSVLQANADAETWPEHVVRFRPPTWAEGLNEKLHRIVLCDTWVLSEFKETLAHQRQVLQLWP